MRPESRKQVTTPESGRPKNDQDNNTKVQRPYVNAISQTKDISK